MKKYSARIGCYPGPKGSFADSLARKLFDAEPEYMDTIPDALRDRLEIIHFPGYTEDEKFQIGRNYLVNKQLKAHGLESSQIKVTDNALKLMALICPWIF